MSRKPRILVLCFDGTTNEFGGTNTNVVKLYSLLRKDKVEDQLCYYQAGIGTYIQPGVVSPLFEKAAEILDDTIAWYLYQHIMDGYKFLMQNYNVGDKVCLFGFSRGAYTARALAGMLHKVGLLSRDNIEQIPFAYDLYKSDNNDALTQEFKMAFSREVPIEFVGVWWVSWYLPFSDKPSAKYTPNLSRLINRDTVASVGFIISETLPFTYVNRTIRVFRQALSLDEHHAKFLPNLYCYSVPDKPVTGGLGGDDKLKPAQGTVPGRKDEIYETDAKEVWFAGCHTDVGGGSTPDSTEHSLANIPLRWMIQEDPSTSGAPSQGGENGKGRTEGSATENDRIDALDIVQPIHDDLVDVPVWWLLEIVPTQFTYQNAQGKWVTGWGPHLGRRRDVPLKPLFHESVKTRMNDPKLKYKPRAVYAQGTESYVT
ncbi:hypothetical protein EDB86DRAFT_3137374 [Lactarius hatsudake]|nr:hypothetical protein EDB86DRAFT_3137374 [Lactarius hatsudake]